MLDGLFETIKDGRICVLCGALDQTDSHSLVRNVAPCVDTVEGPSFKRPYDMVKHLKVFTISRMKVGLQVNGDSRPPKKLGHTVFAFNYALL